MHFSFPYGVRKGFASKSAKQRQRLEEILRSFGFVVELVEIKLGKMDFFFLSLFTWSFPCFL